MGQEKVRGITTAFLCVCVYNLRSMRSLFFVPSFKWFALFGTHATSQFSFAFFSPFHLIHPERWWCWLCLFLHLFISSRRRPLFKARSKKSRVCVLDDASLAKLFDCSVTVNGNGTVLNVQLLQAATVVGNILDALVGDHFTTFNTQLFQVLAQLCQRF